MEDKVKVRELEKQVKLEWIDKGWFPVEGNEFRGYLFMDVIIVDRDGVAKRERKYSAPDGLGGYYVRSK